MDTKSFFAGVFLAFAIFIFYTGIISQDYSSYEGRTVFSPNSEAELISFVESAQDTIDLEMYVFTSEEMARELSDAALRGVKVRIILEKRANSYNLGEIVSALKEGGAQIRWASLDYKLTHTKMMIVDGKRVFVGSTNFSSSALNQNREMAVILSGEIIEEFILEFEKDWKMGIGA